MSVVYKIYCLDENIKDCYIGSTINFHKRQIRHKNNCNNTNDSSYNLKVYTFIRANGGFSNWDFEVLETFNTIDKIDLHKIEGQYIKKNNTTLNCRIPVELTKQEYNEFYKDYYKELRETNKEKINEKAKIYREENKEKLREKIKCECGCIISRSDIIRHRKTKKHIKLMANK